MQRGAPPFEIVVAPAARLGPLDSIAARFPSVRLLAAADRQSPIELAALAVGESRGNVVLLTEDHCSASPDWVRTLADAVVRHGKTIGGSLDPMPVLDGFDWAFYFVDFFRYMLPLDAGPTASLSVCNVGYRRSDLLQLDGEWRSAFHETRVHDELMKRNGVHVFEPGARMLTGRMVGYGDGHRERYSFGRMFAAGRIDSSDRPRRALYAVGTAVLPVLLLGRMGAHALRRPATAGKFARALPHIVTLVLAWSWGEFLGYATATPPRNAEAARER